MKILNQIDGMKEVRGIGIVGAFIDGIETRENFKRLDDMMDMVKEAGYRCRVVKTGEDEFIDTGILIINPKEEDLINLATHYEQNCYLLKKADNEWEKKNLKGITIEKDLNLDNVIKEADLYYSYKSYKENKRILETIESNYNRIKDKEEMNDVKAELEQKMQNLQEEINYCKDKHNF